MATIHGTTFMTMQTLKEDVQARVRGCASLQEAGQRITDAVYESFQDSIVLARLFVTVPFGQLPADEQDFVRRMASVQGTITLITNETPVLTLLGTRGIEAQWNNRRYSRHHLAIPLLGGSFLADIPMIARLLKAVGVPADWIGDAGSPITTESVAHIGGLFYIPDAATARDSQGRAIVPGQNFVSTRNVHTVFGAGSNYVLTPIYLAMIVFTREVLPLSEVERFKNLPIMATVATAHLAMSGQIFAAR